MVSYEHKVKNIYLGSPYEEGTPIIPGDYTLLRGPCDEGFHVPLKEERKAIKDAVVTASQCIGKLHIPLTAERDPYNNSWKTYNSCRLWCANYMFGTTYENVCTFYLSTTDISIRDIDYPTSGYTIRGFRNTPIIPDETRTETVTGKVWHNTDLGLISVLVGTNQYVTLQDKNVGATVMYNNGTLTNDNRGKYFQRGNNYGYIYGSTVHTSSTQVDTTGYGPGNPYSSSTFIQQSVSWSSVRNGNLRGYTDFNS